MFVHLYFDVVKMWCLLSVTIVWLGESTCSVSEASKSNMLYFVAMPQFSVVVWCNPFLEPCFLSHRAVHACGYTVKRVEAFSERPHQEWHLPKPTCYVNIAKGQMITELMVSV